MRMYNIKDNPTNRSDSYQIGLCYRFGNIQVTHRNSIKNQAHAVSGPIGAVLIGHFKNAEEWP